MKTVLKKVQRGKCLKLTFFIDYEYNSNSDGNEKQLNNVNINNIAEARLKFITVSPHEYYTRDGIAVAYLSLKKHALAEDLVVKVNVNSDVLGYSKPWLCTKYWNDFQEIGRMPIEDEISATATIILTVSTEFFIPQNIFYKDVDFTDFTLTSADGSVPIHRACLIAHSPVFKAMLSQEWKEAAEGRLNIDGITLQTLQHLKQYMYLGTLPDDGLRPLLLIAMYYFIDELKSECILMLAHTATSENLDDLLNFASENKVPELTFAILEITPHDVVHGAYQLRVKKAISDKDV